MIKNIAKSIASLLILLHLLVQAGAYTFGYGGTSMYDKMPVLTSDASEPAHRANYLSRPYGGYGGYSGRGFG